MKLSAKQAAQAVGKSTPTITRAIKNGKISAGRNARGGYEIDPAELFRVFPEENRKSAKGVTGNILGVTGKMLRDATPKNKGVTPVDLDNKSEISLVEYNALKARLLHHENMTERERKILSDQIDDLRQDRDQWQKIAQKQTDAIALLTNQKSQEDNEGSGFWRRVFGR